MTRERIISFVDYEKNLTRLIEIVQQYDPLTWERDRIETWQGQVITILGVHPEVLEKLQWNPTNFIQSGFEKFERAKDYYKIAAIVERLHNKGVTLNLKQMVEKPKTNELF